MTDGDNGELSRFIFPSLEPNTAAWQDQQHILPFASSWVSRPTTFVHSGIPTEDSLREIGVELSPSRFRPPSPSVVDVRVERGRSPLNRVTIRAFDKEDAAVQSTAVGGADVGDDFDDFDWVLEERQRLLEAPHITRVVIATTSQGVVGIQTHHGLAGSAPAHGKFRKSRNDKNEIFLDEFVLEKDEYINSISGCHGPASLHWVAFSTTRGRDSHRFGVDRPGGGGEAFARACPARVEAIALCGRCTDRVTAIGLVFCQARSPLRQYYEPKPDLSARRPPPLRKPSKVFGQYAESQMLSATSPTIGNTVRECFPTVLTDSPGPGAVGQFSGFGFVLHKKSQARASFGRGYEYTRQTLSSRLFNQNSAFGNYQALCAHHSVEFERTRSRIRAQKHRDPTLKDLMRSSAPPSSLPMISSSTNRSQQPVMSDTSRSSRVTILPHFSKLWSSLN